MYLPDQLKNEKFIKANIDKKPKEEAWTTTNNYSFDEFKPEDVYGVLCGNNKLVVIDCDTQQVQDLLIQKEEFRNTFTVKTATKKLYHFYFRVDCDNPVGFRINNARGIRILDVQATGTMVIGPGSNIPNYGTYDIVNKSEIMSINYEYLKSLIYNLDKDLQIQSAYQKKSKPIFPDMDELCIAIKDKITIKHLLDHFQVPHNNGNNTECPLGHPSIGKKCFSYTKDVWHCFHCNQAGNVFQLYQKVKNVTFLEARANLMEMAGLDEELKYRVAALFANPKTRNEALELMASEFKKMYNVYTIRNDKDLDIYIYKNGIYKENGKTYINEFVRALTKNFYRDNIAKAVIEKIVVDTYILEDNFFINPPLNLIPFENCILNLETMKTEQYSPKRRFFYKHPVVYDSTIKPNLILQFINDIANGEQDIKTIQELAGYLFWRENKFEKAFMCLGTGRNGKSKLLELFKLMLGTDNVINITLSTLEKDSFSLSYFHNRHANFSPDLSNETLELTGNFKSLVGRDKITANRKFKKPINFDNFAKMVFSTNQLPYTDDQTLGFLSKWILLDFPFFFTEHPEGSNQKLKDANIIDKICTSNEMTGFVNWAIEGLQRLLKNKQFTKSNTENEVKAYWLTNSSTVADFWKTNIICTYNRDDYITVNDFNLEYTNWCYKNQKPQDHAKLKNKVVKQLGAVYGQKGFSKAYIGIKFKNHIPDVLDINTEV